MRALHLALALASLTTAAPAQRLKVGDLAPPLQIAEWIHGEPLAKLEPGKPYVIALWSSKCAGCQHHVDTFNQLQQRFGDRGLRVIVVANRMEKTATLATTKKFVADLKAPPRFALAWDVDSRTSDAYLPAKTISAHPVILVDPQGKVAFFGLPDECELALLALDSGDWDVAKAERWIAEYGRIDHLYYEQPALGEPAAKELADAERLFQECPPFAPLLGHIHVDLLLRAGKLDEANALARKLSAGWIAEGNAYRLNDVAWVLVDPAVQNDRRNLDLGLSMASKAVEMSQAKEWAFLDTLAWAHFARGDAQKAIEVQHKAMQLTDDPEAKKSLAKFEAAAKAAAGSAKTSK